MQIASVAPRELYEMRGKRAGQENREGENGQGWSGQKAGLARKEEAERRKGEVQGERGRVREPSRIESVSSRSSTSPTLHNTVRLPSTASIDWTPYCLR